MHIEKVINNNVVSVHDKTGLEFILMGKGIGFQKRTGDQLDETKIEKTFTMDNKKESYRLEELFQDIPIEHIKIASDCIEFAKKYLKKELSANIYITLIDHINIAIDRIKQGQVFENKLLWDIKQFYPEEFKVARGAVDLVKEQLNIDLPEDEAGFITMHLVNAELDSSLPDTLNLTHFMQDVFNIIKYHFAVNLNTESAQYNRFVTHLKYLGQKIGSKVSDSLEDDDVEFHDMIKLKYKDAYDCVIKIVLYIQEKYSFYLSEDEKMYLTIYVKRIIMDVKLTDNK